MQQKEVLPIGTVLDSGVRKYTIKSVLGQGGFGITYLATSQVLVDNIPFDVSFAIKEHYVSSMNERQGVSVAISNANNTEEIKESIESFLVEARRLNKLSLNHPGIVRVNESFRANGTAYYVMEYIKGQSLRQYVKQSAFGRLTEAEALNLFRPIAETIAYLHKSRLTHLDIKPDNIIVRENGQPVVIDFGLSKHYNSKGTPTSTIKAAGCSAGYSPMEQYVGITTFTPEADIYALAATLLYMLTGRNPIVSTEINAEIIRSSLPQDISTSTANAIVKAMEKLKENRINSVSILSNSLDILNNNNNQEYQDSRKTKKNLRHIGKIYNRASWNRIIRFSFLIISVVICIGCLYYYIMEKQESDILPDYSKIRIGDYMYSDGSFSHKRQQERKCVGIVFNLTTTEYEKKLGYTHGHIVALKDVEFKGQSRFVWKKYVEGVDTECFSLKNYSESSGLEDRNGLQHCNNIIHNGLKTTSGRALTLDSIDAIVSACHYSEKLPNAFSNWYLPASGEWIDIIKNLGHGRSSVSSISVSSIIDFPDGLLIYNNLNEIGLSIELKNYSYGGRKTFSRCHYWTSTYGCTKVGECIYNHFYAVSGVPYSEHNSYEGFSLDKGFDIRFDKLQIRTVAAF